MESIITILVVIFSTLLAASSTLLMPTVWVGVAITASLIGVLHYSLGLGTILVGMLTLIITPIVGVYLYNTFATILNLIAEEYSEEELDEYDEEDYDEESEDDSNNKRGK